MRPGIAINLMTIELEKRMQMRHYVQTRNEMFFGKPVSAGVRFIGKKGDLYARIDKSSIK